MRSQPGVQELTDLVYASLLGETSWQDFLDQLRLVLPNGKAFLFFHDTAARAGAFPLAAGVDPDANAAYTSYYSRLNPWMQGACIRPIGRVVRADSMVSHERLIKTEFYSDWLRPQELESGIGVTVFREERCNFLLSVLSADADDAALQAALQTTQMLVPHLQRAFGWYRRDERGAMGLFNGTGMNASLRVGIVSVGLGLKVRTANDAAARMLDCAADLSIDAAGRLRCSSQIVLECIESILLNWMRERIGAQPATFLLRRTEDGPPMRMTVIAPSKDQSSTFFRGPECILLIEDPAQDIELAVEEFAALHNLSVAEKRLVAGLALGLTLEQVSRRAHISPHTARTQLKHVFAKTGLGRQSDVIRHICLLAGSLIERPKSNREHDAKAIRPGDQILVPTGTTLVPANSANAPRPLPEP